MNFVGRREWWAVGVLAVSLLGGLTWSPGAALSAWTVGRPIVTYWAGPGYSGSEGCPPLSDTAAQQLVEGGWNLAWAQSITELNVAQARGLRAVWRGSMDDATVSIIRNHPALYSYFVADEPSAARFPELAATVSGLHTLDPNHMAYFNLHPSYASNAQLGTNGYQQYLSDYMRIVKPELLSYDHYQFAVGKDTADYFKNLAIISHTAKQKGIPFLNIVQACSWDPGMRVPNGNELRYLYNTSLAYGAAGVSDFVYSYPGFTGGMALANGATTALYDAAKTINPEFAAMAKQIQSMKHIGAYHLGDRPPGYGTTDGSSPLRLPGDSPFTISGIATTPYQTNQPVRGAVLGLWGPDDQLADATCTLVVNLNYSSELNTRVTGPGGDLSVFNPATGKWMAQGRSWYDVTLPKGGSVLVGG